MLIFGICGISGSGKSSVCRILSQKHIPVLDCDEIYHSLISEKSACLNALEEAFGSEIIQNGALNRKALAEIAFSDPKKHQMLNSISHYYVKIELNRILEELRENQTPVCVIDAPLLFEAELEKICDHVIGVVCDRRTAIARIMERDGLSQGEAEKRIARQKSEAFLRENCDIILENSGTLDTLYDKTQAVLNRFLP